MKAASNWQRVITHGLIGFLLAFPCIAAALYVYIRYGHPPVAVADTPFPDEKAIVHIPLNARIHRDLIAAPFSPTASDLTSGAEVYVAHCAVCHGTPNHDSSFGKWEYPTSPQLWTRHANGVVGVSDDPANASYWKVDNGIRLTGMPSFKHILTTEQMWQVSFLVSRADQPLSPAISSIFAASDAHPGIESETSSGLNGLNSRPTLRRPAKN